MRRRRGVPQLLQESCFLALFFSPEGSPAEVENSISALPRATLTTSSAAGGIVCETEADMMIHGLSFVNGACCSGGSGADTDLFAMNSHQGAEACDDPHTVLPKTCSTYACARTVKRVRDSCAGYFRQDTFSAESRDQIAALNHTCKASVVVPSKVLGFQALAGQTVKDPCGATLTDGLDTTGVCLQTCYVQTCSVLCPRAFPVPAESCSSEHSVRAFCEINGRQSGCQAAVGT